MRVCGTSFFSFFELRDALSSPFSSLSHIACVDDGGRILMSGSVCGSDFVTKRDGGRGGVE